MSEVGGGSGTGNGAGAAAGPHNNGQERQQPTMGRATECCVRCRFKFFEIRQQFW